MFAGCPWVGAAHPAAPRTCNRGCTFGIESAEPGPVRWSGFVGGLPASATTRCESPDHCCCIWGRARGDPQEPCHAYCCCVWAVSPWTILKRQIRLPWACRRCSRTQRRYHLSLPLRRPRRAVWVDDEWTALPLQASPMRPPLPSVVSFADCDVGRAAARCASLAPLWRLTPSPGTVRVRSSRARAIVCLFLSSPAGSGQRASKPGVLWISARALRAGRNCKLSWAASRAPWWS